jgi:hypothetical protein
VAADHRSFPPELVIDVKAIACELPARLGVLLSRLHVPDIRQEVITRVWWPRFPAPRSGGGSPWAHRSWIFPRDPDFEAKAARVLDLYARQWEGKPLEKRDYVLSAYERTSIQARLRCHPTLPAAPGRTTRVEHEYDRGGALAYLAAWDVHRARVFGRSEPITGMQPFRRLVTQVMGAEPPPPPGGCSWVVDSGSSHRGQRSIRRLQDERPNLRLIHLPLHASWLNQVEIYFSVIQRKVLTPNDCTDLAEVEARLHAFERRYEQAAQPFEWKFTREDLALLMKRLGAKDDLRPAA